MRGDHQRDMRRNVRLLNWHAAFLNLLFVIPVIVPYYRDVAHVGFAGFMTGEAGFSATVLLMEVPTGWLSDVWTRKAVMAAGTLANIAGWAMLWLAHGFWSATLAQIVLGGAVSLLSGTNSAMLYESLNDLGAEGEFRRREGLRGGMAFYAGGASAVAGGFLYAWKPDLPVLLTWLTSIVALGIVPLLREPSRHRARERTHPVADMAATMRHALRGRGGSAGGTGGGLAGLIFAAGILFACTKMMFWAQQPYFLRIGVPVALFGVLTAGGQLLGGAGGHFGHRLHRRAGVWTVLAGGFAFAIVACAVAGGLPGLFGALLLISPTIIFATVNPHVQHGLVSQAPPHRRATVLSTASLVIHLFSLPLLLLSGWVTERHGVRLDLAMLGVLLAVGGSGIFAITRSHKSVK